ncbi:MAG: helix-turn-helix transcriptional regulator [Verrucomicrobiota bacterium]|jgi:AraC-like DNA-binding protein
MLATDHLSLRLVRLQPGEEWVFGDGENLCLVFPMGGAGKCAWDGGTQALLPGDVSMLKSAPEGKISISGKGEMMFQCFSACFEHLFPLFSASEIGLLHTVVEGLKTIRHYPAANPLALECHRLLGEVPPRFCLDHRGQLLRILAAIFSVEFTQERLRSWGAMRPQEHVKRLFEELSAAEITDCSVLDLARKFNCSTRHLNRIFHEHFGLSVAALRMELRLLRAASMLRDPDVKVISVAERCGFHHLSLFNTCFKRRFGLTPSQYRKTASEASKSLGQLPASEVSCRLRANGLCPVLGDFENANGVLEEHFNANRLASGNRNSRRIQRLGQTQRGGKGQHFQPGEPGLKLRIKV